MPPKPLIYCNGFQYHPLETEDTIRLLLLDPAKDANAPLSGSLVHCTDLTEDFGYYAISYVWGQQDFNDELELRGADGEPSSLSITSNVSTVLRRFRPRTLSIQQYLWIDAICLNQADIIEKAHQIPIMGRIYERALGVHIWLGPEDSNTALVFAFFRDVALLPTSTTSEDSLINMTRVWIKYTRGLVPCYRELSMLPWFFRRWIIQEAWLSRKDSSTVYYGPHSIPLKTFIKAATQLQRHNVSEYATNMIATVGSPVRRASMLELLWKFHKADCHDPKDRIAGIFGLVSKEFRFPMDYSVHWTEMYKQAAMVVLRSGNNDTRLQLMAHFFEFGSVRRYRSSELVPASYPFWVPDWSGPRQRDLPFLSPIPQLDQGSKQDKARQGLGSPCLALKVLQTPLS